MKKRLIGYIICGVVTVSIVTFGVKLVHSLNTVGQLPCITPKSEMSLTDRMAANFLNLDFPDEAIDLTISAKDTQDIENYFEESDKKMKEDFDESDLNLYKEVRADYFEATTDNTKELINKELQMLLDMNESGYVRSWELQQEDCLIGRVLN